MKRVRCAPASPAKERSRLKATQDNQHQPAYFNCIIYNVVIIIWLYMFIYLFLILHSSLEAKDMWECSKCLLCTEIGERVSGILLILSWSLLSLLPEKNVGFLADVQRPRVQLPPSPSRRSKFLRTFPPDFEFWLWVQALLRTYCLIQLRTRGLRLALAEEDTFSQQLATVQKVRIKCMFFQFSARWSEAPYRIKTLKRHRFFVYHLWSSCNLLPFFLHKIGSSGLVDMPVCTEISK